MCTVSSVIYFSLHLTAVSTDRLPASSREDGVWDPILDQDAEKPLLQKSLVSLTRSQLPCDWSRYKHWCNVQHFMTCQRPDQMTENTTSIAFLTTGGRLGNAMSTYSAMLALRKQFGINAMVDLTTFQQLDATFTNVREVPVLEYVLCDKNDWNWTRFSGHITQLRPEVWGKGVAILAWPDGITSEEDFHGAAQFMTPSIADIRRSFRFREKILRRARERLNVIVTKYLKRMNKKNVVVRREDCDIVGVHVRRTDHILYEKVNGAQPLTARYFKQAMELYHEKLKHPIFVVVTDDPEWAEREIKRFFKIQFTGFYDVLSQDSGGLDLAVLTLCNHIVRSRGTFGLWGTILSGNSYIAPKHYLNSIVGVPLELRNQVPLFDISPNWMSERTRAGLRERCPQCFKRYPSNSSLLPGTDVIVK